MYNKKPAFTLVELIVVITILVILWTIGYLSLLGYQVSSRDAVRQSDLNNIARVVELYDLQNERYPPVTDPSDVTFSGAVIWRHGTFGETSFIESRQLSEIPTDPLTW